MNIVYYSFLVSGFAGLSTLIGCIFLFFKQGNKKILISSLAFAAGVMCCVSFTDLLPSSLTMLKTKYLEFPSFLLTSISFSVGVLFSMLIDKYLPEQNKKVVKSQGKLYRIGIISMIAIILHNIPEGIATFMTTTTNLSLGITLAIAIALHNIPEGISISVPIYYATGSKLQAFFATLISGLSEPLGALLAYLFLSPFVTDVMMGLLLALIAGIMTHISFYELLPTSISYQDKKRTGVSFLIGVLIMLLSHILLS